MNEAERQLAVGILLSLTLLVRIVAHRSAGGIDRDQSDGIEREGGRAVAILLRLIFAGGGLGGTICWIVSPTLLPGSFEMPGWLHWVGLISAELGLALLVSVHMALGVHFSGTLHLREGHRLVQSGPYARIRHPMYTSFVLLFAGLSLLMSNLPLASLLLGSQVWTIGWRLRTEEKSLAEEFGAEWTAYRERTGTVTPWV